MANTKTTTRTNIPRIGLAALAAAMAIFAAINLFLTIQPIAASNAMIDARFEKAQTLEPELKRAFFVELMGDQAATLAQRPSDPFGWARLSYLRLATGGEPQAAFAALAMSDFVSPYEITQLPERAVMWYRYRTYESQEQKDYQDTLWEKAYRLKPDLTWSMAAKNNLTSEAGESLSRTNPVLYKTWKDRAAP